jgi:hypothetical protein
MSKYYYAGLLPTITLVLLGAFVHPGFSLPVLAIALVFVYQQRCALEGTTLAQLESAIGPASIALAALFNPWWLIPWAFMVILGHLALMRSLRIWA